MIRLIETLPSGSGYLYGMIAGLHKAYGPHLPFLRFYGDDNGNSLSLMDGVATVDWDENDWDELCAFLQSQAVACVRSTTEFISYFSRKDNGNVRTFPLMKAVEKPLVSGDVVSLAPRELYPFLQAYFPQMPPFEGWYLDVSHRLRHGGCRIAAVAENGSVVSCAMTVSEWDFGAVIGAVATAPSHRRQGLAARCVSALSVQLFDETKDVYICPLTETARRVYETVGFVLCGETAVWERKDNDGLF